MQENDIRKNEISVACPPPTDAGLVFIGRIGTPWAERSECPRQGRHDGPLCRIEVFEPWIPALKGVEGRERLDILYWLDQARRDLILQSPADNGEVRGTFSLRTPVRPNPIGISIVLLESVKENVLYVRGLDCVNGTPLLDIKPNLTIP